MLVTPVVTSYPTVAKSRPVSWDSVTKRMAANVANLNPALEVTKQVPAQQFKGQFVDVLS